MKTKALDHSNTAKAEKVQQASMQHAYKFTALILMDVDLQKIGRKILGLRSKRTKVDPMTQEGTISKAKEVTPTGAEAGADIKTSLCIVCFMRKTLTIGQGIVLSFLNPKIRWHKNQPNLRHQAQ
jgi:hypothetical protein